MRKAQENPIKREQLLDAARELMSSKGYVATSVDEVCSKAGMTKGAFFHYFKRKEDLAIALLTRPHLPYRKSKDELYGKDPLKRVLGQIDMIIELLRDPNSCIRAQLITELSDKYPEIRKISCGLFEKMANDFAKELADAKAKYGGTFDPRTVAELYVVAAHGSFVLTKIHDNKKVSVQGLEEFKKYLQVIIKA